MKQLVEILTIFTFYLLTDATKRSTTMIKKSGKEDLQTSQSGYSYQINNGVPFIFPEAGSVANERFGEIRTSVANGELGSQELPPIVMEYMPPITTNTNSPPVGMRRYSHNPVPLNLLSLTPKYDYSKAELNKAGVPLYPYAQGFDTFLDNMKGGLNMVGKVYHLIMDEPMSYDKVLPVHFTPVKGIPEELFDEDPRNSNYMQTSGKQYDESENSQRGETGNSGYSNERQYATGSKGQHSSNHQKGFYDSEGGQKSAQDESSNNYANNNKFRAGHRGGSFSNAKRHDKGSKTTGYHKVFVKDEFKKDHTFYDKADKRGNFNRYADFDANADSKQGGFRKGGSHNSGFKGSAYGSRGESDKGNYENEDSGYKGAKGDERYYNRHADYANKKGKTIGAVNGYREEE